MTKWYVFLISESVGNSPNFPSPERVTPAMAIVKIQKKSRTSSLKFLNIFN